MRAGKSIRFKLIAWISILFIVMGVLIYAPLSYILPQKIISQILKRDIEIAKYVSEQAKGYLLVDDKVALSFLLRENLQRLEDAQYLFLQGPDGRILSHTFVKGFPRGLLSFNRTVEPPYRVQEFLRAGKRIYDIAIPILRGDIGTLHLGVSLESGKKDIVDITRINYYVAVVILVVLGIGISVFLTIGLLFSRQIIKLKNFATEVGSGHFDTQMDIRSGDEVGVLTRAFNEMAKNLKEKIQEIKRLSTIEERSRIAFDLHDGCAQDLANLIKRLELCERLFKIEPAKAFEELNASKENIRGLLNRTRHIIYELKVPQDERFDLLQRIREFIKDYERQNDIKIALDVAGSVNNNDLSPDKLRYIFFIITEALTNIRKHAEAKNVGLRLGSNNLNELVIDIKDDGKGFDTQEAASSASDREKWGLMSMRQRARSLGGTLTINSIRGQGTEISVRIPFNVLGYNI